MNGYSLVIDISSDGETIRTSTPLKTPPFNMVGSLSDSSTEVYRGSDAELDSTFESPAGGKSAPTPKKKKKLARVSFNLPREKSLDSDSEDYFEEPDSPRLPSQMKGKVEFPLLGYERTPGVGMQHKAKEHSTKELEALYELDIEDRQYYGAVGPGRKLNEIEKPRQPSLEFG